MIRGGKNISEERKGLLSDLIESAEGNPKITDVSQVLNLFDKFKSEVEDYKYFETGYDNLISALQVEISSNGEFKELLEIFINEDNTITMFMAIAGSLKL